MLQDSLTLYKLIILFMLDRVSFPLSTAQVSDFILEKEYTNYLTLQQAIAELTDTGMIHRQSAGNRTLLTITGEGRETLTFFENRIGNSIKKDILDYFKENEFALREETAIRGNFYKLTSGDYEVHLIAAERGADLIDLKLFVPDMETAASICENWKQKNQEIYQYMIKQLF